MEKTFAALREITEGVNRGEGALGQLFKHLYLSAGWDDFINDQDNRSIYGGFSIRFKDDDLKYMLTTTPIPK